MSEERSSAAETEHSLSFRLATPEECSEFMDLLREHMANYVERTMELMQMTWPEFQHLVYTVGQVFVIQEAGQLAGYCWIEERDRTLHVHGLILKPPFQGRGIGTHVVDWLEATYRGRVDVVELGVHESNVQAQALYTRLGFQVVKDLPDLGFQVMQKPLPGDTPA